MNRYVLLGATLLLLANSTHAQSSPPDSQTLTAILQELRLIRTDLRATAALSQRSHVLLFRLQIEQQATAHASDAVAAAESKLSNVQDRKKNLELGLKRLEEERDNESDPVALKSLNNNITGLK